MAVKMLLLPLSDENESKASPTMPGGAPHLCVISIGSPGVWAADSHAGWVVLVAHGCVLSSFEPRRDRHFLSSACSFQFLKG